MQRNRERSRAMTWRQTKEENGQPCNSSSGGPTPSST